MDWSKLLTKDNAITTGEIIGGFIPRIVFWYNYRSKIIAIGKNSAIDLRYTIWDINWL